METEYDSVSISEKRKEIEKAHLNEANLRMELEQIIHSEVSIGYDIPWRTINKC